MIVTYDRQNMFIIQATGKLLLIPKILFLFEQNNLIIQVGQQNWAFLFR
jgi:hypothetical protein